MVVLNAPNVLEYSRTNTPVFLTYLKYISVFYYGYDLMMINQYETITELKCEYSLPALCIENGIAFLEEEKIDRVSDSSHSDRHKFFLFEIR